MLRAENGGPVPAAAGAPLRGLAAAGACILEGGKTTVETCFHEGAAMRVFLVALNTFAAFVSMIWLWGHPNSPGNQWEFWFAFGYLIVAAANLYYFFRRARRDEEMDAEAEEA